MDWTEITVDPDTLPEPDLTENSRTVLKRRYLKCDKDGNPTETPKDLFWRVARAIAAEDYKYSATKPEVERRAVRFYEMMSQGFWVPNSPTLFNAGRELGQLSACFVLPVEDDLVTNDDSIAGTLRDMMAIHQSGGGTGFSFSRLRARGSKVKSTNGVASGPVSFMELYDAATSTVKQGGNRRGANMGIMRVDHPDIEEFIHCKADTEKITNFNISVAVTDEFMRAAADGDLYDLRDPRTGEVVGQKSASKILDKIIEQAHATGEPGLFFIDEANRYNPVPHLGSYEATNPCGEQPLLPYDVCNLGSINLAKFVKSNGADESWEERVQWSRLGIVEREAMRFLDNVIDANEYPLPKIRELADKIRRVGAGVMGWADFLVKLGIPYDSEKARQVARKVASFLHEKRLEASEQLAQERGTFPAWEESIWGPDETCARDEQGNRVRPERPLRNCNVDTVAPTGTISIIAGCSGGIEPLYAVAFMRNQAGTQMQDINPDFVERAKDEGWYSEELMDAVVAAGSLREVDGVPEHVKEIFCTAHDIAPSDHIRMQAAWQEFVDSAISKTINFPKEADPEDVREGYMLAHELNCKGVTVYRDGSREGQALQSGSKTEDDDSHTEVQELPDTLEGRRIRVESPLGRMYVHVNEYDGDPIEVFVNLGKAGGAANADAEAIGRLISVGLRAGVDLEKIYKQLRGISSERTIGFGQDKVLSTPDGVAQALARYMGNGNGHVEKEIILPCPDCGSEMQFSEGCAKCPACAYSECG